MASAVSVGRRSARPLPGPSPRPAYLGHIHNFRGFAIFVILVAHSFSLFDWSGSPGLADFLKRVFANGTIFFLFISGYLFQHLSAGYRPAEFMRKKLRNVLVPYLVVSAPAILVFTLIARRPGAPAGFYEAPVWEQVIGFLVTGTHLAPFWYIPTLFVFFAASPLLHWLDRRAWFYYSLPLLLLLPVLVPRSGPNPLVGFVHYLPAWVAGMAGSRFREEVRSWLSRGLWSVIALAALFFVAELLFSPGRYGWYSELSKLAMALVLVECFRRWGSRVDHWFALPGTLSFGLYLIHSYVISGARAVSQSVLGGLPSGGWVVFGLGAAMVIGTCLAITEVISRKLGPLSRLVVGVAPLPAALPRETLTSRRSAAHRGTVR